jgi:hypothetical protein
MDEVSRPLASDERALFEWFFDQWPELNRLSSTLPLDMPAEVFALADDGYCTLSVTCAGDARLESVPSPYEGRGEIDGHPFEVLFFVGEDGAMVEVIWSAGTWPGRLPRPAEVQAYKRS